MNLTLPNNDWHPIIIEEMQKDYFKNIQLALTNAQQTGQVVYPPQGQIFRALTLTSLAKTKVVILGQDPYINANEANGLSFSVNKGNKIPPSLKNVFKELSDDIGMPLPTHGDLTSWANQGVLLLNTILTVEAGTSKSHRKMGWQTFTDQLIKVVSDKPDPVIFLLWGNDAIAKTNLIDVQKNTILTAKHPSPLARGAFFGCGHFSKVNEQLKTSGLQEIVWQLPE